MSQSKQLTAGTRGSDLAKWQTNHVADELRRVESDLDVKIQIISTKGDQIQDVPLWQIDGKAFFTRELDEALLDGRIDYAVHSLKDLATQPEDGISIAAILPREDPRDVLVTSKSFSTLEELPPNSTVGTSSLRRRAFIARLRKDLTLSELRGNVPTRAGKVSSGELDAVVLAAAGLKRLGMEQAIAVYLPVDEFPPAPGQGAVAVCTRSDDPSTHKLIHQINDRDTQVAVDAERSVLAELEGGCHTPLGAYATVSGDTLTLHSMLCDSTGGSVATASGSGRPAEAIEIGRRVAADLLEQFGPIADRADLSVSSKP